MRAAISGKTATTRSSDASDRTGGPACAGRARGQVYMRGGSEIGGGAVVRGRRRVADPRLRLRLGEDVGGDVADLPVGDVEGLVGAGWMVRALAQEGRQRLEGDRGARSAGGQQV